MGKSHHASLGFDGYEGMIYINWPDPNARIEMWGERDLPDGTLWSKSVTWDPADFGNDLYRIEMVARQAIAIVRDYDEHKKRIKRNRKG